MNTDYTEVTDKYGYNSALQNPDLPVLNPIRTNPSDLCYPCACIIFAALLVR